MADITDVLEKLKSRFGERSWEYSEFREGYNRRITVAADQLYAVMQFLKEDGFDLLVDVTCVDYLHYRGARNRFGLVYILDRTSDNLQLIVRCYLNEPDLEVPSMVPLWAGANWFEREVYDMFGIRFANHPDLRRILMPEEFAAYPLRKDYPLRGRGERHNFERISRDQS